MSTDQTMSNASKKLKVVLDDIKSLKIQGASDVAIEGVAAFAQYAAEVSPTFSNRDDLLSHLHQQATFVRKVRVTEPALANGLQFVLEKLKNPSQNVDAIINTGQEFKELLINARKRVGEIGAQKILDDTTIMTHCHSSFVDAVLWKAKELGRRFRVVNTETRPVYQGRKTVRKMREKGIDVIHVVDSAMWWAMKEFDVDLILIGADANRS